MEKLKEEDVKDGTMSRGINVGSICCEAPNGTPIAPPSWCGGGNFSLLLFAFACVINLLLCFLESKDRNDYVKKGSVFVCVCVCRYARSRTLVKNHCPRSISTGGIKPIFSLLPNVDNSLNAPVYTVKPIYNNSTHLEAT